MSEPGSGKTWPALEAYARYTYPAKGLVTCTRTNMASVWGWEIRERYPHLKYSILSAEKRLERWREDADIYIINHDGPKWLHERLPEVRERFRGGMLMNDESSYYKHRSSGRAKAILAVRRCFERATNLTGSPDTNTILDIWHQAYLLDYGRRLGSSFYKFRNDTCKPVPTHGGRYVEWHDKEGAELAVAGLLRDITVRHKCRPLPPNKKRHAHWVMSDKQMKQYKSMQRTALLAFESGALANAVNAASMAQKLLQIASGAIYTTDDDYQLIDNARYEYIADLVAERKHSLVFMYWHHQKHELVKSLKKKDLPFAIIDGSVSLGNREKAVEDFQAGKLRAMLLQPQSAAHGLTLTKATATIWPGPPPQHNLEHFLQGNRRMLRRGLDHETETLTVVAEGTGEQRVYDRIGIKQTRQQTLLDLLT